MLSSIPHVQEKKAALLLSAGNFSVLPPYDQVTPCPTELSLAMDLRLFSYDYFLVDRV